MDFDKEYCHRVICLYLKDYLSDEQFWELFSAHISAFQMHLKEDLYLEIIFTNLCSKERQISLRTKLYQYILQHDPDLYRNTNDESVERLIASGTEDGLVHILKKRYERKAELYIECGGINTSSELIHTVRQALRFPAFCGANWDAIEDLICGMMFPEKLVFINWGGLERRLPQDADILKMLLEQYIGDSCVIVYE